MNEYYKKLISTILLLIGIFLLIEHLWSWGYYDFKFLCHSFYGLVLIIIAYILNLDKKKG